MQSSITNGIEVSVTPSYETGHSDVDKDKYIFSYKVRIQNLSGETVQLLYRKWRIFDVNGTVRQVEGEGVVGQQPVLGPGDSHEYQSWCPLMSPMGYMEGSFQMMSKNDNKTIDVKIPRFELIAPFAMN